MTEEGPPPEHVRPYTSRQLFGRLWRGYLRPHLLLMVLAFLVMSVEGATLGAMSSMLEPLFDRVFAPGGSGLLLWVGGAIFGLFLLRAITSILGRWLLARVNQRAAGAMQVDMLRHLLTLDASFYHVHSPGSLIERIQGDTMAAQGASALLIAGLGRDVVSLISLFIVAIAIDPYWTLAALVGVPLLLVPAYVLRRYLHRKASQTREQAGQRVTRMDEIFHGIHAVKLNRLEDYQAGRFQRIIQTIIQVEEKAAIARAAMPAMVDVVTGIGFFAVLLLGGSGVASGERTVGEFMAFFTAMTLTFQPIRRLSDLAGQWQVAEASLERVFALLDTKPSTNRPKQSRALPAPGAPEIRFEDVTFAYGDRPVLNGLNFTAEAGKVTALVGSSGAGKTTVFQLIAALFEPQAGRILIGGVDVQEMSLFDQRALLAAVSQDAALFDETLLENLLLGRTDRHPDKVTQALDDAEVSSFLPLMPLGVDTRVGTRGSALSGGQRQRVAIARALLADAPILLLDEATSALDTRTEASVSAALSRAQAGRTTLVIAHRLSTVKGADKIIVLDQGQVVEEGTHDSLMAQHGPYARLHGAQLRD